MRFIFLQQEKAVTMSHSLEFICWAAYPKLCFGPPLNYLDNTNDRVRKWEPIQVRPCMTEDSKHGKHSRSQESKPCVTSQELKLAEHGIIRCGCIWKETHRKLMITCIVQQLRLSEIDTYASVYTIATRYWHFKFIPLLVDLVCLIFFG